MLIKKTKCYSALLLCASFSISLLQSSFADQIITDGKTQTTLTTNGHVTDVRTETVNGVNGYNSFSKFDVYKNNVVNLHLPRGTENLLNFVHDSATNIDGILNSIKNGQVGGNVYLMNPNGITVGASGTVNVGSLTMSTPDKAAMNNALIRSLLSVNPDNSIFEGKLAINPDATIFIDGKINAIEDIDLYSGAEIRITNTDNVLNNASFTVGTPDFSDVVNTNGITHASDLILGDDGSVSVIAKPENIIKVDLGTVIRKPINEALGPNIACADSCSEQIQDLKDKLEEEKSSEDIKREQVKEYRGFREIAPVKNTSPKRIVKPTDLIKSENNASFLLNFYHELGSEESEGSLDEGAYKFIEQNK